MIYRLIPIIILLSLSLGACNSDIFIDGPVLPEESFVTIDGDGGEASFTIPVKGLKYVSIDRMSDEARYFTWYNKAGDVIPEYSPASELHEIVFETQIIMFTLTLDGSHLHFKSIENCSMNEYNEIIRLEYDYGTRFININILPGRKREVAKVDYQGSLTITPDAEIKERSYITYNNSSAVAQRMKIWPYLNFQATAVVNAAQSWAKYETIDMPLPVFEDGEWKLRQVDDVMIGSYCLLNFDDEAEEDEVIIPPHSNVRIITIVTLSSAEGYGSITFRNPVSGRESSTIFTCKTKWPTSYDIRIENVE